MAVATTRQRSRGGRGVVAQSGSRIRDDADASLVYRKAQQIHAIALNFVTDVQRIGPVTQI